MPESHSTKNLFLSGLTPELRARILRIYLDLTSDDILKRCMKKRTQNPNESFHSKLWRRCLKIKDARLARVKYCSQDTILIHNFGQTCGSFLNHLRPTSEVSQQALKHKKVTPMKTRKRPRLQEMEDYLLHPWWLLKRRGGCPPPWGAIPRGGGGLC